MNPTRSLPPHDAGRRRDKVPTVRAQAVLALKRLQEEDDVLAALRNAMEQDTSKCVRAKAGGRR